MKKLFVFIVLVAILVFVYYKFCYNNTPIKDTLSDTENQSFYIEKHTIFGTHLNINACMDKILDGNLSLVLKNDKEEITIDSIFERDDDTCFKLSDKNNGGIYLDNLKPGNYVLLVKQENEDIIKYYNLKNNTEYDDLVYYTITRNNKNNKVNIKFDIYDNKNYLNIKVNRTSLPKDVYDITIDPGHGGSDPGARYKLGNKVYNESDLTLKISLDLKEQLEDLGLKVKLTRESDKTLSNYGSDGRGVIGNKVKSKYSLSIHINSLSSNINYGGVEIYTPNDIDYTLARLFADNISNIVGYSKKQIGKMYNGVYYTYFTKSDIEESKKEMKGKNLKAYDIKVGAPYMFMIRELGGINTYAYIDGRNLSHGYNEFFNSNQTTEPYLLELGYINYEYDLKKLSKNSELFSKAIKNSLEEYLNNLEK